MKKLLFSIRDVKADYFGDPIPMDSVGVAIRQFSDAVLDGKSQLAKHPEDFALYKVGEFFPGDGVITALETPLHIANASEFVRHE